MADKKIIAYKAFNKDFTCRGFQYEVGKTYKHEGEVEPCEKGFHACENPLDVWDYYPVVDDEGSLARYAKVEASGRVIKAGDKLACSELEVLAELSLGEFIEVAVEHELDKDNDNTSTGDHIKNVSTGDYAKNASTGDYAKNASTGYRANNVSTGEYAANASTGNCARNVSTGDKHRNASTGDYTHTIVGGENSVTADIGSGSRVRGVRGTLVCLCHYDGDKPVKLVTGRIGWGGLKPNTWYTLDKNGKFMEVAV